MKIDTLWGGYEPLEHLLDLLQDDHIDDVFEEYGSYCALERSARPGEWGYFILAQEEDQDDEGNDIDYMISLQIPVDEKGDLLGLGRLVFNTPDRIIEEMPLSDELTARIYAEVHDRILDELDQVTLPSEDDGKLLADYGIWMKRRREGTV